MHTPAVSCEQRSATRPEDLEPAEVACFNRQPPQGGCGHAAGLLTWKESQLLKFRMDDPGRIFSREEIMVTVWGPEVASGPRTVDVHIRRLRHKLAPSSPIRTVKNVGYGFIG